MRRGGNVVLAREQPIALVDGAREVARVAHVVIHANVKQVPEHVCTLLCKVAMEPRYFARASSMALVSKPLLMPAMSSVVPLTGRGRTPSAVRSGPR